MATIEMPEVVVSTVVSSLKKSMENPEVVVSTVVSSLKKSMEKLDERNSKGEPPTIHQIPIYVRRGNESAYTPTFVSIGPYHQDLHEQTKGTKISYLKAFLQRTKQDKQDKQDKNTEKYAYAIKALEQEARDCYHDRCNGLGSKEFVQMMVLDGCFIIEFLLKVKHDNGDNMQKWLWRHLRNDLMLMENQIPFFILNSILEKSGLKEKILDLCLLYLQGKKTKEKLEQIDWEVDIKNVHHLLHLSYLYHKLDQKISENEKTKFVFQIIKTKWQKLVMDNRPKEKAKEKQSMIPTATELNESGVTFKKKKDPKNITDVRFENGTMEIPVVCIDDCSSSTFRNYLALEHNCPDVGNAFSNYALFMDYLVDTASDVALLKKRKIIVSRLGCDEDVAKLFNGIAAGLVFDSNYLDNLFHYLENRNTWKGKPSQWWTILKRKHLSSPWTFLSLVGAVTLLAFTATQLTYAVKNYRRM